MAKKLYRFKVAMTIKTEDPSWINTKKAVNMCMNCGIVNELTPIKEVRFIQLMASTNKKGKAYEQTKE